MQIETVVDRYQKGYENLSADELYHVILDDYSKISISTSDFWVLVESGAGAGCNFEKLGASEIAQRKKNSECMRDKMAGYVADLITVSRNYFEGMRYVPIMFAPFRDREQLSLFRDATAEKKKQMIEERFSLLFEAKSKSFEWKPDEELTAEWEDNYPLYHKCSVLEKVINEAEKKGIHLEERARKRIEKLRGETYHPANTMLLRCAVISNVYYAQVSEEDLRRMEITTLREMKNMTSGTISDYLQDMIEVEENYDKQLSDQLTRKVKSLGYKNISEVLLGNMRGREYTTRLAMGVLKTGRPVYVLGENRRLIHVIESAGPDGFLKPITEKKQEVLLGDYLQKAKVLMQQLSEQKEPLLDEGKKAARLYMAKMVCYEKMLNERRLGGGKLEKAIGESEKKFNIAVDMIYNDPIFQNLTKDITVDALRSFVQNHGEKELNRRYVEERMADKVSVKNPARQMQPERVASL